MAKDQKKVAASPAPPTDLKLPKTREALRQYQRTQGLPATGDLDDETLAALHGH